MIYNKSMFREYFNYLKDNPKGLWFKRKLYGWGWVPVTWQGWLVVAVSLAIGIIGTYLGDKDDSPGLGGLSLLIMIGIIFFFGYKKGEKPRWQWGLKKGED